MKEVYDVKESVGLKCVLKDNGAPLTLSGYTVASEAFDEIAKGELTVTVLNLTDNSVASDTNGTAWTYVPMFANGSVFSEGVITVAYGFAAGNYCAVFWLRKGVTLEYREVERKRFEVKAIQPPLNPPT